MKQKSPVIAAITIALFLGAPALLAQGWTQLPNTTFNSVAAPNNFTATYASHTMPSYAFADNHYRILDQWGSAWADTKRNRLCFYGGGHNGPNDNSIECLDLQTLSSSTATCGGQTCITTSNGGSVPAMTRINDPSVYLTGCPAPANPDGTPLSMQDWGGLVYLPKADKYFSVANATICPDDLNQTWLYDPTQTGPSAWTQGPTAPDDANAGKECALDPTTAKESVTCLIRNTNLYRFTCANSACTSGSWAALSSANWTVQNGSSVVIDPDRRILFSIGPNYDASSPKIYAISLDNPTVATDKTSSVSGCTDLMAWPYASLVWDPSIHRIVGYVPQAAANPGKPVNEIFIFDAATMTCVMQPQLGGSGPAASGHIIGASGLPSYQGTSGHFAYFPALGEYVLVNNETLNAYTFKLNVTAVNGLGSSTLTCLDRDGDGYGVGPGCIGPDADDLDASVQTASQFLAKWSTLPVGLNHLGYRPANIWYVSTTGNDSTGAVNNASSPFATCCGSGKANPAPGDAVLLRNGTYSFWSTPSISGTSGNPIIFMSYPGELAYFDATPSGFDMLSADWVVEDNIKFFASGSNGACVSGGWNNNMVWRHINASGCEWGIDAGGDQSPGSPLSDVTVEDSVLHDAPLSGGQHGLYLTCHGGVTCPNIFVRRNLLYNNPYTGMQFNGKLYNIVAEQNITYSNLTTGISITEGVQNSYFRSNISINDAKGIQIFSYNGNEGVAVCGPGGNSPCNCVSPNYAAICAFDTTGNLIENFTAYLTGLDATGGGQCSGGTNNACAPAIAIGRQGGGNCSTTTCLNSNLGGNTFRNLVLQTNNTNGNGTTIDYPPIQFQDSTGVTYLATTTFDSIVAKNLTYKGVVGFGPGSSGFGFAPYTCGALAAAAVSSTNCLVADPQFISASSTYWNSPSSFNLNLASSSPAIATGSNVLVPSFDAYGAAFSPLSPTMGAISGLTTAVLFSKCDLNQDGVVNVLDVQLATDQAIGATTCGTADLEGNGQCTAIDVNRVGAAALGGPCVVGN